MHEYAHSAIEAALVNMLRSLPPEVAEKVRLKYEEDRSNFLDFAKKQTPSKDPAYWAKHCCKKCYGRGIIGIVTNLSGEQKILPCACTSKTYAKWLIELRKFYNELKEQGHEKTTD